MLISTRGRYALRILIDMAEHRTKDYIRLSEIAVRQEISEKYLESIVKELVRNKIIIGLRGKGGGYKLACEPEKIVVGKILTIMEGSLAPVVCLEAGSGPCPKAAECRTVEFWRGLNDVIQRYTSSYTIADLVRVEESGNDYII